LNLTKMSFHLDDFKEANEEDYGLEDISGNHQHFAEQGDDEKNLETFGMEDENGEDGISSGFRSGKVEEEWMEIHKKTKNSQGLLYSTGSKNDDLSFLKPGKMRIDEEYFEENTPEKQKLRQLKVPLTIKIATASESVKLESPVVTIKKISSQQKTVSSSGRSPNYNNEKSITESSSSNQSDFKDRSELKNIFTTPTKTPSTPSNTNRVNINLYTSPNGILYQQHPSSQRYPLSEALKKRFSEMKQQRASDPATGMDALSISDAFFGDSKWMKASEIDSVCQHQIQGTEMQNPYVDDYYFCCTMSKKRLGRVAFPPNSVYSSLITEVSQKLYEEGVNDGLMIDQPEGYEEGNNRLTLRRQRRQNSNKLMKHTLHLDSNHSLYSKNSMKNHTLISSLILLEKGYEMLYSIEDLMNAQKNLVHSRTLSSSIEERRQGIAKLDPQTESEIDDAQLQDIQKELLNQLDIAALDFIEFFKENAENLLWPVENSYVTVTGNEKEMKLLRRGLMQLVEPYNQYLIYGIFQAKFSEILKKMAVFENVFEMIGQNLTNFSMGFLSYLLILIGKQGKEFLNGVKKAKQLCLNIVKTGDNIISKSSYSPMSDNQWISVKKEFQGLLLNSVSNNK